MVAGNRSFDGEPIDATEQYINERPSLEEQGADVEYATEPEPNGEESLEWWPDAIDADPEDLTEDQRAVIKAAVIHEPESGAHCTRLAGVNRSKSYGANVLRRHWPEKWDEIRDEKRTAVTPVEVDKIRVRALEGESVTDIAEDLGRPRGTVRDWINGRNTKSIESECSVPPLEYSRSSGYSLPDGEEIDVDQTAGGVEQLEAGRAKDEAEADHGHDVVGVVGQPVDDRPDPGYEQATVRGAMIVAGAWILWKLVRWLRGGASA